MQSKSALLPPRDCRMRNSSGPGHRPDPEGSYQIAQIIAIIRPLTLSLSPQAGRGNKCSGRAPCYPLAIAECGIPQAQAIGPISWVKV